MESGFFVAIVPVPGSNPTQEELDDMIDVSLFNFSFNFNTTAVITNFSTRTPMPMVLALWTLANLLV